MARVKVTDQLTSEGRRLQKSLEELDKLECFIGFQRGEATHTDGGKNVDMTDIAAWNDLGTGRGIPSRPFLRNTVDLHGKEINSMLDKAIEKIMNGATAEQVLREMGVMLKGKVQEEITDGSYKPNAPSTVRKKKSDKPLIDTGLMRESVNYQIKKKGEFG